MSRFIPDYDDELDWQCGSCGMWNKNRWRHCRNCKEPCPIEEAHQLFKQLAEGTLGRDEIEAADLAALEGES